MKNVYGGCKDGDLTGSTSVTISNTAKVTGSVYGGGNATNGGTADVTNTKTVTIGDGNGLLSVASDETASSLTVKATSTVNPAKSATAAVSVTSTPVTKYVLTVTNGTGSGSYATNDGVQVTATPPATGKVFDKWTTNNGGSFASETSESTTFTMPANVVTVTATYKDAPVDTVVIDTAITAANNVKKNIVVNNNPASSVARGTRFVTSAEMNALNAAITVAQNAKSTVTTPQEAQMAAHVLDEAVKIFSAAIKTGTYTSCSCTNADGRYPHGQRWQ